MQGTVYCLIMPSMGWLLMPLLMREDTAGTCMCQFCVTACLPGSLPATTPHALMAQAP